MKSMKTSVFLFFTFLLTYGQVHHNDIAFEILNKVVKNNDVIDLKIINHSSKNYYLPLINNNLSEKLSFEFEAYFFLHTNVSTQKIESLGWCNNNAMGNCNELHGYWENKRSNFTKNDFILLKSHEFIKIRIPFHSVVEICNYVKWFIPEFDTIDKKYIYIWSTSRKVEIINQFLSSKLKNYLKQNRYELYEKPIWSNRVLMKNK
jgi:hypothetical protein